jgi:uncharacterized protein with HEPN domain
MTHSDRDFSALKRIVQYCNEIETAIETHELTLEKVQIDSFNKNALSMSILQIGELSNVLSQGFKAAHSDAPWREIKRMCDKAAHHYGEFDVNKLWETVKEDITPLKAYCLQCISELENAVADKE